MFSLSVMRMVLALSAPETWTPRIFRASSRVRRIAGISSVEILELLRIVRYAWPGPRIPAICSAKAAAGCSHGVDVALAGCAISTDATIVSRQSSFIGVFFLCISRLGGLYRLRAVGIRL